MNSYILGMEGCTDGGCILRKNTGMVTNGGCSCERELSRTELGRNVCRTLRYVRQQGQTAYADGYRDGWLDAS